MVQILKRVATAAMWTVISLIILTLAPQEIKSVFPSAWGRLEGLTGIDHTGFAFTPWFGEGACRILNARAAFAMPGAKIVFGTLTVPRHSGSTTTAERPHLWALAPGGGEIDLTAPGVGPRRIFAVVDPTTLNVDFETPASEKERQQTDWALKYLAAQKKVF